MKCRLLRGLAVASFFLLGSVPSLFAQDGKGGKAVSPSNEPSVDECINDLRNGDMEKKLAALRALERLGPKAKAAVPDLVAALQSKDLGLQNYAVYALSAIGPDAKDALPMLRQMMGNAKDDWTGKPLYAGAILRISQKWDLEITRVLVAGSAPKSGAPLVQNYLGTHSAELVPHLIVLLDDLDPQVRVRSAEALLSMSWPAGGKHEDGKDSLIKKMGDKAKPIGPALVKHLDDMDVRAATAMANALTHVDPELAPKAIPYVIRWLKQPANKGFNDYSAKEILQPIAKVAIPKLIEALDEKDAGVRGLVASVLAHLEGSLDSIVKALQHEKEFIRAGAAKAIALKYAAGAPAAPALVIALKDAELVVRFAAADALVWTSVEKMREAVPVLVEVIRDGNEEEQKHAVSLLPRIGPPAKSAVPSLIKLLDDPRYSVRFEAALALTAIDARERVKAVHALIEGTESTNAYDQHQAAKSLALIGPAAKEAVPALEKLFTAKYVHARYSAAEAVALIDPTKVESAIRVIVATLGEKKNQSSMVRTYALGSLRRIGAAAKSAIPTLDAMLLDDGPFHGEVAVTAVCIAGEDAKAAIKFIRDHLGKDPVDDDAEEIVEFLPNVGPNAKFILPEIRLVLEKTRDTFFQEHLCETIAVIGPDAKDLEPQLRALIAKTKRPRTIEAAEKALIAIGAKK